MSLSIALLGFMNYTPLSGYDFKKIIDDSINFFWSAQTSQIYRELKSLEKNGLIYSKSEISDKGPDKKVYHITDKGKAHLVKWIEDGNTSETFRNEFMIWLLFSSNVSKSELLFQLKKKLKEYTNEYNSIILVEKKFEEYSHLFGKYDQIFYWKMVLKRGYYDVEAKIRWAEDIINDLKEKNDI